MTGGAYDAFYAGTRWLATKTFEDNDIEKPRAKRMLEMMCGSILKESVNILEYSPPTAGPNVECRFLLCRCLSCRDIVQENISRRHETNLFFDRNKHLLKRKGKEEEEPEKSSFLFILKCMRRK